MKRKPNHIGLSLLAGTTALVCALGATNAYAQTQSGFYHPLTLAAADAAFPGGGPPGDDAETQQAELAKKLQNPVAALISVPIQNNWDFGIGQADAMKYTVNIQPVVPLRLDKDWNLIIRPIMPVIYAEAVSNDPLAPASARESHAGLGDITQS